MTSDRLGATLRLALWIAGLVVAGRLLLAAGSPTLSVPITSPDQMSRWTADTPPADMAMALLRLAALAAVGYLLAVTGLGVAARLLRARGLAVLTARASPAVVHRIVSGGSGVGLALGAVVGSMPAPDLVPDRDQATVAATPTSSATATMVRWPEASATMTRIVGGEAVHGGEATMTHLGAATPPDDPTPGAPAAPLGTGASRTADHAGSSTSTLPAAPAHPDVDPTSWIVEPGDSLWSIAEEVATPPDGSQPDERDVGSYWRRLVEANRAQLVDPANPDLLLPGQRLVVPPADS